LSGPGAAGAAAGGALELAWLSCPLGLQPASKAALNAAQAPANPARRREKRIGARLCKSVMASPSSKK
jgi:hypothetical protein